MKHYPRVALETGQVYDKLFWALIYKLKLQNAQSKIL